MTVRHCCWICLLLCLFALFSGCQGETTYSVVETQSGYGLEVASYLSPLERLHPEATVRYGNVYRNQYLLVQHHRLKKLYAARPKADLEDFYALTAEQLLREMSGVEILVPDSVEIDGLPALMGSLQATHKGDQLQYLMAVIEGDTLLYQVLAWSSAEKFGAYEADARRMIQSFNER